MNHGWATASSQASKSESILTNFLLLSYELFTTFIRTFYAELSELGMVEFW